MKKLIPAIMLASALLLSGCSGFKSSAPPTAMYTIHAAQAQPQGVYRQKRIVSVAEPSMPPGYDTDRIAISFDQGRRMDYAAGAAWPAPLPKMLQDFVLHSANAMPGIMAVAPDSGLPATSSLQVRVNDFEPVYAGDPKKEPPVVRVSMTFTLMSLERNRIIATVTKGGEQPASANTLTAITGGLETVAQDTVAAGLRTIFQPSIRKRTLVPQPRRHLTPGMNISSKGF
jgi:ABC-type uncharacterized transport system auxiliary subunit